MNKTLLTAGLSEERDSNAAFLFSWQDGNTSKPVIKLPKVTPPPPPPHPTQPTVYCDNKSEHPCNCEGAVGHQSRLISQGQNLGNEIKAAELKRMSVSQSHLNFTCLQHCKGVSNRMDRYRPSLGTQREGSWDRLIIDVAPTHLQTTRRQHGCSHCCF